VDTGNPETGVSLCIPRVFNNIGWRRIKKILISCGWGFVDRVDVVPKGTHKRAFIHFAPGKWNTRDQQAMDVLKALQDGKQVKVVYDEPWYWLISLSKSAKPDEAPKPPSRPMVSIEAAAPSTPPAAVAAVARPPGRPMKGKRVLRVKTKQSADPPLSPSSGSSTPDSMPSLTDASSYNLDGAQHGGVGEQRRHLRVAAPIAVDAAAAAAEVSKFLTCITDINTPPASAPLSE
jgi:hypothetical protein